MNYFNQLKNKVGDFWWYSLMIFIACRSGDVIQAFIGLWLVPKYVGTQELGAIMPLQQLCFLFAAPIAAMAVVFSKYVTTYATRGEYGKVKSFVIDVSCAAITIFIVCIVAAYLIMPYFYVRLKIVSGLLTLLILLSGFTFNFWQLIHNALQGLKKFNTLTVVNFIGAPIRLVTLLVAMPVRALSGYVLGQTTPPATSIMIAAWSLFNDLKKIKSDVSWRKDLPEIFRYFLPILIFHLLNTLFASMTMTIYRQRLPEVESAAYYILSRFAETATYVGMSMSVVLFPLAAEAHTKGRENTSILKKTITVTAVTTGLLGVFFCFSSPFILNLTETWRSYGAFAYLLPVLTIIIGTFSVFDTILWYETACRRYRFMAFYLTTNGIWCAFLLVFTGYEFFRGLLPNAVVDWVASTNMASLERILWAQLLFTIARIFCIPFVLRTKKR